MITEKRKAYLKKYRKSEARRLSLKKYNSSPKGKATHLRFRKSEKGKLHLAEADKKYRKTEARKSYISQYHKTESSLIYQRRYQKERLATDLNYKIKHYLRNSARRCVKDGSAIRHLGCTADEFKAHIEKQFKPGMTWANHGRYGWHYDHIIPLSSFNLEDRQQCLAAFHYTNYQPLWADENLSKSDDCEPFDRFMYYPA